MAKEDYNISIIEEKGNLTLVFEGSLTLNNMVKIKKQIVGKVQLKKMHNISLKNVTDIDASFMQLLLSINKINENINYDFNLKVEQTSLLSKAGLIDLFNK